MIRSARPRRLLAATLAACIGMGGLVRPSLAVELIGAEQVAQSEGLLLVAGAARGRLLQALDREEAVKALAAYGVTPAEARARIAALSDAEAERLLAGLGQDPAGGSELIGTLVLIAVLLVFSDILGFTHLFPFLKPAR
jgi:hypothetical protein